MSQDNRLVTETCCLRDQEGDLKLSRPRSQKWVSRRVSKLKPSLETTSLGKLFSLLRLYYWIYYY